MGPCQVPWKGPQCKEKFQYAGVHQTTTDERIAFTDAIIQGHEQELGQEKGDQGERAVLDSTVFNVSPPEERSENVDYVKPIAAPKPLQDGSDFVTEPLDTIDLSTDPSV